MNRNHSIEGYAIVSEDGMLANADRQMPDSLKFKADQEFFEHELDRADVVVHGRHSQEQFRQSPLRQRLILTTRVPSIAPHPSNERALFWNPAGASFDDALTAFRQPTARIAVIGGTDVFGLFLELFDAFHLTKAPGVWLPGGRPVFPQVPIDPPEQVLAKHGFRADATRVLDATKHLILITWRRISPAVTP